MTPETTPDPPNLFGPPGAERLHENEASAAEAAFGWAYDECDECKIEEWTARHTEPLDPASVVENLAESACEEMVDGLGDDIYVDISKDEKAIELASALVDHIHSLIRGRYQVAVQHIATHTVRIVDGRPEIVATEVVTP